MSTSLKKINLTKNIPYPNEYIKSLYTEFKDWVFDEVSAPQNKGQWNQLFSKNKNLNLEIGPGNGKHFSQLCLKHPKEAFLSIELKYKPLIQTIRRVRKNKNSNGRAIRYNALLINDLFAKEELDNVYIHFPDPWLKKRKQKKHQLIQEAFCKNLYDLQKPSSFLEFKTDSVEYFHQSVEFFKQANYTLKEYSLDLYKNQKFGENFSDNLSQFELLFFQKNKPINRALFIKK